MHHRSPGRVRTFPARRSARPLVARRALLVLAVALVAAAGAELAGGGLKGPDARPPASSPGVVDAAAHRAAQGVGPAYEHAASSATRSGAADGQPSARSGARRHG